MTTHAPTAQERAAFVASRPKRRWWQTRRSTAAGTVGGKVVYFARGASVIDPHSAARYLDNTDLALRASSTVAVFDPQAHRRHSIALTLAGLRSLDEGTVWMPTGSRSVLISPDETLIPSLTLAQNLVLPCAAMGHSVDPNRISIHAKQLAVDLDQLAENLSADALFRFQVLRALIYRADLVIISALPCLGDDTPFSETFSKACARLRTSGACVVFLTDCAQAAASADRVLIVANSTIVADASDVDEHFIAMACEAINEDPSSYLGPIPRAGDPVVPAPSPLASSEENLMDEAEEPTDSTAPAAAVHESAPRKADASAGEKRIAEENLDDADEEESGLTPNWHPLTTRVVRTADSPLPTPLPSHWDENPETTEIALAAIAEAERFHRIDQARASMSDELKDQLNEDLAGANEANPEDLALIEHAQKILDKLPGSVIPDDEESQVEEEPELEQA